MTVRPLPSEDLEAILQLTRPLWEEMRGERLFVTGGTGFFGSWLMESFCHMNRALDLQAQATILTRDPEAFKAKLPHIANDPALRLIAGDIRSFAFPEGTFRFVVHAAVDSGGRQGKVTPLTNLSTMVDGTARVLEFAANHGTRKLLFTSSGAVYGRQPADLTHLPENFSGAPDPCDPGSMYGEGKRMGELLCALYQKQTDGLECKIARCFAFCGPHLPLDAHFAIGNFIRDALAGQTIRIAGDGTPRRSYLYASDLAVWLWTILFVAPPLVPFNVGSAADGSILELAQMVSACLEVRSNIEVAQQAKEGAPPLRYVPSVDRASQLLGLRQTLLLPEIIRRTASWYTGLS